MMNWLRQITGSDVAYHGAIALIILAVFWLLAPLVKRVLGWIGVKFFAKTETQLDDRIIDVLRKNVQPLMVIIGLHVGLREMRKAVAEDADTLAQILDYAEGLVYIASVFIVLRATLGIIRVFIDWYLGQLSDGGAVQLKRTLGPLTSKIFGLLLGLVAIIIVLDHFGVNIGSMLVSLGVGSLAVALAAQDTLANMIAGFVILVDQPFRVGDRIELPSGQIGDVERIGLRSTQIINFESNVIIVPNAELVKGRIVNFSYPHNQMRALVRFGVAYGVDPEQVRAILLRIADAHPDLLKDPKPEVFFSAMNDSSLEFTLIARAEDYMKRFKAECDMREQAYVEFQKAGIEIPFPQRVVHMKTTA